MLPDNFDIFEGTIKDFIDKICILLYSETTVCFEVAAKGVPCIYIDTGKGLLGDTMFNSDALKWSAKSPEELKEVFQRIIFKDIGELNKNRVAAGKYVKTYFHPVSENELEKFIER
jgi:hypothetical protein